jgi:hypothetical protein
MIGRPATDRVGQRDLLRSARLVKRAPWLLPAIVACCSM